MNDVQNSRKLMKLRVILLKNFIKEQLYETPGLISLVFIIPLILYLTVETITPFDLDTYSINPNIKELLDSFSVLLFQMLYYLVLFSSSIYILFSYFNIKVYGKYKTLNISFKSITLVNLFTLLMILDVIIAFMMFVFLLHTRSNLTSIMVLIVLVLISISVIVFSLNLLYQMASVFFIRMLKLKYMVFSEMIIVILMTIFIQRLTKKITINMAINTSFFKIVMISLFILTVVSYVYHRIQIDSKYILRESIKTEKTILNESKITIPRNYILMLYTSRRIYLEYIYSLLIFVIFSQLLNQTLIDETLIFELLIPMFLISSGLIYSYKNWYALKDKKYLNQSLNLDVLFSMLSLLISSIILSFICYSKGFTINVALAIITFLILSGIQRIVQLKYKADHKYPLIFILLYGSLTFIIFEVLKGIIVYV